MKSVTEILGKYTAGEASLEETNAALKEAGNKCSHQALLEYISERTSISISTIKHWCAGHHSPSDLDKIKDIAHALEIDTHDLLKASNGNTDSDIFDSSAAEDVWVQILAALARELSPVTMAIWFAKCKPAVFTSRSLILCTKSDFYKEIIELRYAGKIKTILSELYCWDGEVLVIAV